MSKPNPADPADAPQAKPVGVAPVALAAILVGVMVVASLCCGGAVLLGSYTAVSVERDRARREAMEADIHVVEAMKETALAVNEAKAELEQASADASAIADQANETRNVFAAELDEQTARDSRPPAFESELRTWTRGDLEIEARFVRVEGAEVILRQEDGAELRVPLSELSPVDQCIATMSAP